MRAGGTLTRREHTCAVLDDLRLFPRYVAGLSRFLGSPTTLAEARRRIGDQLGRRDEGLLTILEHGVYANPHSPYLALLRHAGVELGDVRSLVREQGVHATLTKLREEGVHVTLEEFKGADPDPPRRPGARRRAGGLRQPAQRRSRARAKRRLARNGSVSPRRPAPDRVRQRPPRALSPGLRSPSATDGGVVPGAAGHHRAAERPRQREARPSRRALVLAVAAGQAQAGAPRRRGLGGRPRARPRSRFRATFRRAKRGASPTGCVHLALDKLDVGLGYRRLPDGTEVQALSFTTLHPATTKLMINVESDDFGELHFRRCECEIGRLGFDLHVHTIRSFEKITSEGTTFLGADLLDLVEGVLPTRFGWGASDFQLVETERAGLSRVLVVVSPQVGPLDEEAVVETVLGFLSSEGGSNAVMANTWILGETVEVVRREPYVTAASKILPLHVLEQG
jgi:hypothetical protein